MPTAEPSPPTLRAARAAVFAALCVLVGAVGHDAFSVGAIPLWALLVGGGAVFLVVAPLTQRERGLPTILALMAVVQLGLHELFASAQGSAASMSMPMAMPMPMATPMPPRGEFWCGHSEPAGVTQAMQNVAMPTTAAPHHSMTSGMTTGMIAAHVLAALVAAWWLRRGEAAVWSLARTLGLALITPLVLLVVALVPWTPPRRVGAVATRTPARLGPGRLLRFDVARRGPPMTAAAFA
ncbi:conserved hypothetical protein [Catenulispora acidiphila DSM 44928]|uniref:Integral membrane protein n=1 Tax=Catenulispora acidiphila (strain DSM 44928 / JCM 14897 / NBRC 102108 / NRRL B-24433 / ID139908) TaxID=479433 RepID=C7Q4K9_CATAD|nr:hypothetical protein [Catenulispora acidiphila]ACU71978.1 conserved hypothetical protein [Catenulispora acidiphila DSM 44928]